jgi:hypothetical protein
MTVKNLFKIASLSTILFFTTNCGSPESVYYEPCYEYCYEVYDWWCNCSYIVCDVYCKEYADQAVFVESLPNGSYKYYFNIEDVPTDGI